MNKCLEVKNLSISFGGLKAVDSLDFSINEGEIYGLIGPHGGCLPLHLPVEDACIIPSVLATSSFMLYYHYSSHTSDPFLSPLGIPFFIFFYLAPCLTWSLLPSLGLSVPPLVSLGFLPWRGESKTETLVRILSALRQPHSFLSSFMSLVKS